MNTDKLKPFTTSEKAVITFICSLCGQIPAISRVVLYGSRARRDHHDRSDFDLAILAPKISAQDWAQFVLDVQEHAPTLCGVDVIRFEQSTATGLAAAIAHEGIEIYVRP